MIHGPRLVLGCAVFVACGLQRDYEAFLKAAANDSDVASSTGATGSDGTGSTGAAGSGETGPGDSGSGSTGETSGGLGGESSGSSSTGETGGTGSTGGTTGASAVCGDGVVEGEEECDEPEGGTCYGCVRDRLVFVTSKTNLYGDWAAGSPIYWCNHLAGVAGLLTNNVPRFVPWVSDSEASAAERIHHSRGRYVLRNGLVFARSWDDLIAGKIENPLNVDEASQTVNTSVWTDTRPDGTTMPGTHCNDWTSKSFDDWAYYGEPSAVDGSWTLYVGVGDNPVPCAAPFSLYCFESP